MKQFRKSTVAVTVLIAVTACGGGSDGSSKRTTPMVTSNNAPTAISGNIPAGKSWLPQKGSFKASDTDGDSLKISDILEDGKSVAPVNGVYTLKSGTLSVKGLDYVYTPLSGQSNRLQFVVSDGTLTGRADLEISAALSDPLAEQQWHLRNTGQKAYALGPGLFKYQVQQLVAKGLSEAEATKQVKTQFAAWEKALVAGEDMNVAGAYSQGVTGQNTIAVVVDQGLEIAHEDLEANVLPNRSLNFKEGALNPTDPTYTGIDGDHGTSVAGLIAAVGWNGKGGRGVAPETKLIGMNFLEAQTAIGYSLAHGLPGSGISVDEHIVFNRSYGETIMYVKAYSEIEESLHEFSATQLRGGKGAVSIKASGNSFFGEHPLLEGNFCDEGGAATQGLTCFNANMEGYATSPYYFVVGAVNSDGKHTSYSTAGANLLVVAPAGEFGDKSPAMITTDQMTCLRGYSSFAADDYYIKEHGPDYFKTVHPFDYPGHEANSSCNYTSIFNGTSSAAPNTSGVVSLILSANPTLTYRDVRHILVSTSTKVDAENVPVKLKLPDGEFIAHSGWVKNKAGFEHNNLYGFGRVNAGKAVEMAKNYKANLGELKLAEWTGLGLYGTKEEKLSTTVPDNSAKGAELSIEVPDDIVLEGAQFRFTVANSEMTIGFDANGKLYKEFQTTAGTDLAIEVTSPQGTRSVLLNSKQALLMPATSSEDDVYQGYLLKDSVMLSQAFYGEKAKGTWKIKVLDANGADINATGGMLQTKGYLNNTALSMVEGVAIRVYGH
jgi:subtilisin family serine protease